MLRRPIRGSFFGCSANACGGHNGAARIAADQPRNFRRCIASPLFSCGSASSRPALCRTIAEAGLVRQIRSSASPGQILAPVVGLGGRPCAAPMAVFGHKRTEVEVGSSDIVRVGPLYSGANAERSGIGALPIDRTHGLAPELR